MSVNNYFKYKWTKCSNPENRVAEWIKKENKLHIPLKSKKKANFTQHFTNAAQQIAIFRADARIDNG